MEQTFENLLFPKKDRMKNALGNVAHDKACGGLSGALLKTARKLYPGFESVAPESHVGMMSLLLPVGCNANCPQYCYTGGKLARDGVNLDRILELIDEFAKMGGKILRIVGDGEPTLYDGLLNICAKARGLGIDTIVFTNGIGILSEKVLQEYEKGRLYFYVKMWSESQKKQTDMVRPKKGWAYEYHDGAVGSAPVPLYQLLDIDPARVGIQVMASSENEHDVRAMLSGLKKNLPILLERFIPAGSGKGRMDLMPTGGFPYSKACSHPPRGSYHAVVDSRGFLRPGIFVSKGAMDVRTSPLRDTWEEAFISNPMFTASRYTEGCFCERFFL